jgi:cyclic pyranopterin phosphate synthase
MSAKAWGGEPESGEAGSGQLSHVSAAGDARMVDVSAKGETHRVARATGLIRMASATLTAIVNADVKKGDVLGVARVAGMMAAKRTADLIPLCHPLALTNVQVDLAPDDSLPGVRASATVKTTGRTGVEMEALTAVSVALLTIYDMAKALDRGMEISDISLAEKSGGVGGNYTRLDGTLPRTYPESGRK